MPRNMSFAITTQQMRERTKTVTRRLGWDNLQPGEIINACVKCMGLRKGERVECICQVRCVSNRPEPLSMITKEDCVAEGFSEMTPAEFVDMFCRHNKCQADKVVNRIEFEYL